MKENVVFYHAGCPVCVQAEVTLKELIDPGRYTVEVVHLGERRERLPEARQAGVQSVPAFVRGGKAYHLNHGADLTVLG